jgi:hypothetical protein
VSQLHIFCADTEDLETASGVRNTDIDFMIEMAKSHHCWVNGIGTVGNCHDCDNTRFDFCAVLLREILVVSKYLQNEYLHTFSCFWSN